MKPQFLKRKKKDKFNTDIYSSVHQEKQQHSYKDYYYYFLSGSWMYIWWKLNFHC